MTAVKKTHSSKSLKGPNDWGSKRHLAQNGTSRKTGSEESAQLKNQGVRKKCGRGAEGKCGRKLLAFASDWRVLVEELF